MTPNENDEIISLLKEDSIFEIQQPDKTIKDYRLFDLRHASDIDIMFMTTYVGKIKFGKLFNPNDHKQLLILLSETFGYHGIIDLKGEIHFSQTNHELKESISIPILDKTLFGPKMNTEKIEDFGEKIGGAKKDRYASLFANITRFTQEELINSPTDKTLLPVDYSEMFKDGIASLQEITLLKYLRENIGKKPTSRSRDYLKKEWLKKVELYQRLLHHILENRESPGEHSPKSASEFITGSFKLYQFEKFSKIIIGLGFPSIDINLNGHNIVQFHNETKYSIVKNKEIIKQDIPTFEDAIHSLSEILTKKSAKDMKFNIFYNRGSGKYFIGKKLKAKHITLMDNFTILEDAVQYLKENQEQLESLYEKQKIIVQERRESNNERVGKDYLKGADVTPEMFSDTFGFRGVEFGNWVNHKERQTSLNQAYTALMDLSTATNITPKAISLNGELGLAFGSRGSGSALAHYESNKVVINLTKKRGAGSLAHEWWHALDNYFSRKDGLSLSFITETITSKKSFTEKNVREEMYKAFLQITNTINKLDILKRSKVLDFESNKNYWATARELAARCFECWIVENLHQKSIQNDYLANFKGTSDWALNSQLTLKSYPYPNENEKQVINDIFTIFFDTLKEKSGENGKRILYRRVENEVSSVRLNREDLRIVEKMSKALHTDITLLENRNQINHLLDKQIEGRFPGFYDPNQDKVYIILSEVTDQADLQATILHEVLAHKGLRTLFKEDFVPELKKIWNQIPPIEKIGLLKQNEYDWIRSTEEYMAQVAEHYREPSRFEKVKAVFKEFFRNILKIELKINDNDLRFILHKAKKSLKRNKQEIGSSNKISNELSEEYRKNRKKMKR